jgi:hypothetical protein
VTLPDPPDADGELDGDCSVVEPSSPRWSELEVPDWSVVVDVELLAWLLEFPGRARAAMAENAAVAASAPASSQRVSLDTRRSPASRRATAPRSAGPGGPGGIGMAGSFA